MTGNRRIEILDSSLQPFLEHGNWAGLVRYWLAHDLHPRVLEEVISLLGNKADLAGSPQDRQLASFFKLLRQISPADWPLPGDNLFAECNSEGRLTLLLIILTPLIWLHVIVYTVRVTAAIREQMLSASLEAGQEALKLAQTLGDIALQQHYHHDIASVLWRLHRREEAFNHITVAVAFARRLRQQEPNYFSSVLASSLNNLALLHKESQHPVEACTCYLEAIDLFLDLAERVDSAYLEDAAKALTSLGAVQYVQENFGDAHRSCERALSIYRTLENHNPTGWQSQIAAALYDLATTEYRLNDLIPARSHLKEALELLYLLEQFQTDPDAIQVDIAKSLNTLGLVQFRIGEPREAQRSLQEALRIRRRLAKQDPDRHNSDLAMTLNNLAKLAYETGAEGANAEALLEASEIDRISISMDSPIPPLPSYTTQSSVPDWVALVRKYLSLGDLKYLDEACARCTDDEIVKILKHSIFCIPSELIDTVETTAERLRGQSRTAERVAVMCLSALKEISTLRFQEFQPLRAVRGANRERLLELALICEQVGFLECAATFFWQLGKYHAECEEFRRAKILLRRALENFQCIPQLEGDLYESEKASVLNSLGSVLSDSREFAEAESLLLRAIKLRRRQGGSLGSSQRQYLANAFYNLGRVYLKTQRPVLAKAALEESYQIYNEKRNHLDWLVVAPLAAKCAMALSPVKSQMGDPEGADRLLSEAIALLKEAYASQEKLIVPLAAELRSYKPILIEALANRARSRYEKGRIAEARIDLEECLQLYDAMPEQSRSHVRGAYVQVLTDYAYLIGEVGEAAHSLEIHHKAVWEAERPVELTENYIYKGLVRSSYRALIKSYSQRGDSTQVFRSLAALREKDVCALGEGGDEVMATCDTLAGHEKKLHKKICVLVAETLSGHSVLLSIIRGSEVGIQYFTAPAFSQIGARLIDSVLACIFSERTEADPESIERLGRAAWKALPEPVQKALTPQENSDVLISGDPGWAAFPWEALRIDYEGKDEWLGRVQTLTRWSPITATGLSRLTRQSFGNGNKVAAVICPWDALPRSVLPSAQREAARVSATLCNQNYLLVGGDALVGKAATKSAVLQAISMEPSIVHFAGHGYFRGGEEVLLVSGDTSGENIPFGRVELLQHKKEQRIAGRLFKQSPLFVMNSCFTGRTRSFGGYQEDLLAFLIEEGAAAVIASPFPVHDLIGELLGQSLYENLTPSWSTISDVFMHCRSQLERHCICLPAKFRPLWMLWRLYGNPYAHFP